nr:unnamed protein product [Callosobruchus chinensis]
MSALEIVIVKMCPISGLVQFLIVLVALLLLCHAVVVRSCQIHFKPTSISKLIMYDTVNVSYSIISDTGPCLAKDEILISNSQNNLAGTLNITGNFLGKTSIKCKNRLTNKVSSQKLDVIVVRRKRVIDVVFTASVAMLVSILYINFGCAIDWSELSNILKRPVGPAIGFFGQFVIMPLLSYVLGLMLFPDSPEMRLGMFFTGVSPAGGASNVWAVVLEGNMSLSIIMTAISTIAAFGMMPLWIFTLGKTIFDSADLRVPYREISTYVIALIVPLAIGYLIQRYLKRVATFMTRIIKGFSACLILFIIIFAIVTNLYLFQLFSWKIILAGMGLPWIGYLAGYICGYILRQPHPDNLTIAIEVGIQNTGIAIFLLSGPCISSNANSYTVNGNLHLPADEVKVIWFSHKAELPRARESAKSGWQLQRRDDLTYQRNLTVNFREDMDKQLFLVLLITFTSDVYGKSVSFSPDELTVHIEAFATVRYEFIEASSSVIQDNEEYVILIENDAIARLVDGNVTFSSTTRKNGSFVVEGESLGRTRVICQNTRTGATINYLDVTVIRPERVIDSIFTASVATLISVIYINFGAALDWCKLKEILKRPIGPAIAFCGQFIFQPLVAYGLGKLLFPETADQQLGLLFTGASPGGGASNLWTLLLGGNVGLSIVATAMSTIAAFAMMPFWLFTLGRSIFESGNIEVPYGQISTYVFALIVPLTIGYLIQRYKKNVATFLTKIMKAFTALLLIFVVVFAIVTNLYLFELFSWQITVAGMCLPWLGYFFGYIVSKVLRQSEEDCIAIAVEIGIQNTGIAIFLLRFTLPQPEADLTTVIPVSVAILTPLPLILLYVCKLITAR